MTSTKQAWISIEDILEEICDVAKEKAPQRIGILGAGMAGLAAAYELKKLGYEVEILEGSDRVGGRVWTKRFEDGQYGEYGAMRIPGTHDYTRYYIEKVGLKLGRFITSNAKGFYDVRGVISRIYQAIDKLYPQYKNLRKIDLELASEIGENGYPKGVGAILGNLIEPILKNLSTEDKKALYDGKLTDKLKKLDAIALRLFLGQERPECDGATDLIGELTGLEGLWEGTIIEELRGEIEERGNGLQEIIGGMDRLPNCLADKEIPNFGAVRQDIQFGNEISSITTKPNEVEVLVGKDKKLRRYDYVLCTIPFSVLRRLELNNFSNEKMLAIRNITYASSTKVLLECKERFWEDKYGIVGGASISASISRQTYYPSDNSENYLKPWEEKNVKSQDKSLYTISNDVFFEIADSKKCQEPGVLLGSYTWGQDARRLGVLSQKERSQTVINSIAKFHPEIASQGQVRDYASMFWDENKWSAGAFTHFAPSDTDWYYRSGLKPEGRLYFAGEHLSPAPGWIQGAIFSSLQAVFEMVKSFPSKC
ncbi:MAG: NAD(P)/FAD-dependent oxidoreductase [Prochloraceae cyanobacterium]|nr:NAD(P)/FAD-dependent oxidoreductase [Prochloraceae cyanobacterium]